MPIYVSMLMVLLSVGVVMVQAAEPQPPSRAIASITWSTSLLGNTLSGGDARNRGMAGGDLGDSVHMQNRHEDMWVGGDGTVVMNTHWDEGHHEVGIYRDGKMIGYGRETGGGRGGFDVTGDGQYIYAGLAVDWSFKQRGVARFTREGQLAGWPGSTVNRLPLSTGATQGLAWVDGELFASDPTNKRVVVIRTADMVVVREFALERPGKLAVNPVDKTLWMILGPAAEDTTSTVIHLGRDGSILPGRITDLVSARGLAFNPKDGLLAFTENGPDQQVVFYAIGQEPKRVRTFGAKGGVMAGTKPGLAGDDRFYGPRGIGFDAAGNLYVACSGAGVHGTELRSFDPAGKVRWRLQGMLFVDCAAIDPADDHAAFSVDGRFVLDPAKPAGQDWRFAAYLQDRRRFPGEFPIGSTAVVCRIAGKRILYTLEMEGGAIGVYRFAGELAVPCGMFTAAGSRQGSPNGRCMWLDANGDQQVQPGEWTLLGEQRDGILGRPDAVGNIWIAGWGSRVRVAPCQGLDARGAPIYTKESMVEFPAPEGFSNIDRVAYIAETDTLYVCGNTPDRPRLFPEDKQFITGGRVLGRIDGWWKGGNRRPVWTTDTRRYDAGHDVKSFAIAGDLLFTVERQTSIIEVFDAASGEHLQQLVPGAELGPVANHVFADLPYSINAHRCTDGSYIVLQEDDVYGKNIPIWCGPVFRSAERDGDKMVLAFDHATRLKTSSGELQGFAIAGND